MMRAALVVVVLAGCSPAKPGHFEESSPPLVFTEGPVQDPRALPVSRIQPGECPAEVGEYPVPYFNDQVLLRLPEGVTADNFVEYTPGVFVRLSEPIESTNCHDHLPGATIHFMAMTIFDGQPRPDKPLESMRDEVLEAFGYPDDIVLVEHEPGEPAEQAGMWVYEVPPVELEPDPAKILLSMQAAHGHTLAIVYEVHPDEWSVIVDTLVESARHLSILSP